MGYVVRRGEGKSLVDEVPRSHGENVSVNFLRLVTLLDIGNSDVNQNPNVDYE